MEAWLLLASMGGACAVAFLHSLAVTVERECRAHELQVKAAKLRRRYAAQLRGETVDEAGVIEVDEAPPVSIPMPPPEAGAVKQAA
ncbi:MAG: hypothetical protein ACKVU4_07155 [Phycisphaerales bacterium]